MKKEKVYILQKDLPDYKAGEEFTFDGMYYKAKNPCEDGVYGRWPEKYVENNPDFFKLKEANKPIVTRCNYDDDNVYFYINNEISSIKFDKERLAQILINESSYNWERESNPMSEEDVISPKQKAIINGCLISPFEDSVNKKIYSQKEYLQFGNDCFDAARKNNTEWYFKYKNFSDYMNIKNEVSEK